MLSHFWDSLLFPLDTISTLLEINCPAFHRCFFCHKREIIETETTSTNCLYFKSEVVPSSQLEMVQAAVVTRRSWHSTWPWGTLGDGSGLTAHPHIHQRDVPQPALLLPVQHF